MKDNLCAHCIHAVQVAYSGFLFDETGYTENKSIKENCGHFQPDELSDMTKRHGLWIPVDGALPEPPEREVQNENL